VEGGFTYLLRHSAVSLLIDAGAGIEEVADLIGDDPRTLIALIDTEYAPSWTLAYPWMRCSVAQFEVLRSRIWRDSKERFGRPGVKDETVIPKVFRQWLLSPADRPWCDQRSPDATG
jgi:hypothetical protein